MRHQLILGLLVTDSLPELTELLQRKEMVFADAAFERLELYHADVVHFIVITALLALSGALFVGLLELVELELLVERHSSRLLIEISILKY